MMPGVSWGVYTYGLTEGTEVSSTYEGRHITATAAELITDGGSGVAVKGHACVFGLVGLQAVGVCFNSGTLTDLIAIDTEGIWNLPVTGKDDGGNRALSPGEPVFIDVVDCEISGERNNATQIPFGYLLTEAATTVETISAVKVHWDPRSHWLQDQEMLYFGDARDVSIEWDETNLEMLPLTNNTGAFNIGNGTLSMDVQIFGAAAASYLLWDNSENVLELHSAIAGAANEGSLEITTADAVAGAGLIGRGIHVNYDNNGAKTGAQAEANGISIDMDADANVVSLYGVNVYTAAMTGATINRVAAYACYIDDAAVTVNDISCIHLETAAQTASGSRDYISMRSHFLQDGILTFRSGGDVATHFLVFDPAIVEPCVAFNAAGNGDYSIKCYINGETTYLHTYDAP